MLNARDLSLEFIQGEPHREGQLLLVEFESLSARQPLDASRCYCGPSGLNSYLTCNVSDDEGAIGCMESLSSSAILDRIVKPGENLVGSQDISGLYDMSRPGKYVIQPSRRLSDAKDADVVKSNKAIVTIIQYIASRFGLSLVNSLKISFANACTVLIFLIVGLLLFAPRARRSFRAYRIPRTRAFSHLVSNSSPSIIGCCCPHGRNGISSYPRNT